MSLWSHVVYHFVLILLIHYTSVTHQSDYININTVFYLGETNECKRQLFYSVTVLHAFVAKQGHLLEVYQLVHLNVDFSAGAEKIRVARRCHHGKDT